MLAPSELSIQAPFLGIGTIGNVMLVNKRVNTYDICDGLFNYLWDSNNNNPFAQPPSIASKYICITRLKRGSEGETTAVDRFPQTECLSNFPDHGIIEFRAESRELVNLQNSMIVPCTPYGVLYHWHTTVNVTLTIF